MVVDSHPTLLNVTLHPSKVGVSQNIQVHLWQPPWLEPIKHQDNVIDDERDDKYHNVFFHLISESNTLVFSFNNMVAIMLISKLFG